MNRAAIDLERKDKGINQREKIFKGRYTTSARIKGKVDYEVNTILID